MHRFGADDLARVGLVRLLADEYGERSLTPVDTGDLRPTTTLAELVALFVHLDVP